MAELPAIINIYFHPQVSREEKAIVDWVLQLIKNQFNVDFIHTDEKDALLHFSHDASNGYFINTQIYNALYNNLPVNTSYINSGIIYSDNHKIQTDFLASIFYRVHLLHELNVENDKLDKYGRINYNHTYEITHTPWYEDKISDLITSFFHVHLKTTIKHKFKNYIHFTHDIDFLNSGFRQEFLHYLKRPSFQLCKQLVRHLVGNKKIWNNISDIIRLENQYGIKSTFYLLPSAQSDNHILHADYSISELKELIEHILNSSHDIGIHKSTHPTSYRDEMQYFFPHKPLSNRNHYLKYNIPNDWYLMAKDGILLDTGLAWADHPGLRNHYPVPYKPFTFQNQNTPYIVPLVAMDTTFIRYLHSDNFMFYWLKMVSHWKNGYCVSVLFHNNNLTPYSSNNWLKIYESFLQWTQENNVQSVTPQDILEMFTS